MEGSLCPCDEELVYGSYIGRKRKLKLNRKLSAQEEAAPLSEQSHPSNIMENGVEPWLDNSPAPVAQDDFLEELKRKDQLLAQLLQLDQPSSSPLDQNSKQEQMRESENTQLLIDPVPSDRHEPTSCPVDSDDDAISVDENTQTHNQHNQQNEQNEQNEHIYSIYASEEEGLDKSIPYSSSTPTVTESTPNHTVLSSGDYETITTVISISHSFEKFWIDFLLV